MTGERPRVTIAGVDLPAEAQRLLDVALVDQDVNRPDMFELRFRDPSRAILDRVGLRIAAEVRISASSDTTSTELITADVTSLEAELEDETGSHLVARGYDRSYRMARSARVETYHDVTDGDLVRAVAQRSQIVLGQVDDTTTIYPHVFQAGLTDWAFLRARARAIGWLVSVDGGRLASTRRRPPARRPGKETSTLATRCSWSTEATCAASGRAYRRPVSPMRSRSAAGIRWPSRRSWPAPRSPAMGRASAPVRPRWPRRAVPSLTSASGTWSIPPRRRRRSLTRSRAGSVQASPRSRARRLGTRGCKR